MLQKFRRFIAENRLIEAGDKILLAVSGGIDSMVMSHLFLRSGIESGIAHCNFSLRASESDSDEEMVRQYASFNNIDFFTIRFETKAYAKNNGISVQMAARELRYNWFEKIRLEHGYDSVAVAHNLNDNIETLLINLVRGTGIAGLTGMRPSSNNIIRPLLFATREQIIKYSKRHSIIYREDQSNADTKYLRNKIRHLVIPLLKEINPSIESTLNDTAEIFRGINEMMTEYTYDLRKKLSEQKDDCLVFKVNLLISYSGNKSVLFELFRQFGIARVSLDDLLNIIRGKTGGRLFTGSHMILKNRDDLLVIPNTVSKGTEIAINKISDFKGLESIESVRSVKVTGKFKIPGGNNFACLDTDKLNFPLILRKWKAGDYFFPLGMKHKKKLSDYFTDNKFSIPEKENALILESDGKIACILGERIDNRFRITRSTSKALIIKARKSEHNTGEAQ